MPDGLAARFCGLSMVPGIAALTVMPFPLTSSDGLSVTRSTATFDATAGRHSREGANIDDAPKPLYRESRKTSSQHRSVTATGQAD